MDSAERVRVIENEVDQFYEQKFPLRDFYAPAVKEVILDRAELAVTGHKSSSLEPAKHALLINVLNSVNLTLRTAHRMSSRQRSPVPDDLCNIATRAIGLGMAYGTLEDAFYSYWKGYASANFPEPGVLRFVPNGTILDARLRMYHGKEEIRDNQPDLHELLHPESPTMGRFVDCLIRTGTVKKDGGLTYTMDNDVISELAEGNFRATAPGLAEAMSLDLGDFRVEELIRGWSVVRAVSQIHKLVSLLSASNPEDSSTSVNWPVLYRKRSEWWRWFSSSQVDEKVISALMFDFCDRRADVALTPIVELDEEYLGVAPTLVLGANICRNVMALVARKYQRTYSAYTALRERKMLEELKVEFPAIVVGTNVSLPKHHGKQLPDIDLLLASDDYRMQVIGEVKCQLEPSDTREVVARNEYLKYGQEQLASIREFLLANSCYLKGRGLARFATEESNTRYLLLCKGHLGSEDVIRAHSVMADVDFFRGCLSQEGLERALNKAKSYDYLPEVGRDFVLEDAWVRFGSWKVIWKQMGPARLPPDDETGPLEDLYQARGEYA